MARHGPARRRARPAALDFAPIAPDAPNLRDLRDLRVAVVHDWCPTFRGGERVLARICRQFPRAEVFTLFDFLCFTNAFNGGC